METNKNSFSNLLLILVMMIIAASCDGRYQGNKDTQIDSAAYNRGEYDIDQSNKGSAQNTYSQEPVSTHNAVKVNVPVDDPFWGRFRDIYHVAIREGQIAETSNDIAMGPWLKWTDALSYQQNFRYANNELWIQTFYREEDYEQASTPQGNKKLLTIDLSDSLGLSNLWHQMDERARHIEDSILNRSQASMMIVPIYFESTFLKIESFFQSKQSQDERK
jgi:hypothetical protein